MPARVARLGGLAGQARYREGVDKLANRAKGGTRGDAREPLTRDAFVKAALELIDADGLDALTTRTLGDALGVHGTAVYRHFANMDELTESVLAYMLETSGVSIPETGSPRERIIGLLRSLRRAFAAHPNLALPNLLMQDEQATAEFVTVTLDLLAEMGLQGRDLVVAYQVLETFTVGTNAYDWGGYPDALEARRRGRRLSGHPAFDDASRSLADVEQLNDDAFEVAAAALLDAVEAMAGRKRRRK